VEKLKAAIIGLGRIASLLEDDKLREKPCTHAGAIAADPDCILVAGCDMDAERCSLFAEKWNVPVYADAAEMISAHAPQILVIATHGDSHYHYCRLAANYGVPVIICEKPLADNIKEARKIAALANSNNGFPVIITNHERRYSQDYIRARAVLAEEKLGRLLCVNAKLCMGIKKRLVDVFWHDGTHLADAIMFLTDSVLKHKKRWGAKLHSTSGTAWLEGNLLKEKIDAGSCNPMPIPVIMEIGAGRDHLVFEMEFSCEKGRLHIGNNVFEIWESLPSPYAEKFRSLKKNGETFTGPTGYFSNMIKDACFCARNPGTIPRSSSADGLRVIEYLNAVRAWK